MVAIASLCLLCSAAVAEALEEPEGKMYHCCSCGPTGHVELLLVAIIN